jgi:hypothetical protein
MSFIDEFEKLVGDIKKGHLDRAENKVEIKEEVKTLNQATRDMMSRFVEDNQKSADQVKTNLEQSQANLKAAENGRQNQAKQDHGNRESSQKARAEEVAGFLSDTFQARQDQARADKKQLQGDVAQLKDNIVALLHQLKSSHQEMGETMRRELTGFMDDLKNAAVADKDARLQGLKDISDNIDELRKTVRQWLGDTEKWRVDATRQLSEARKTELDQFKQNIKGMLDQAKAWLGQIEKDRSTQARSDQDKRRQANENFIKNAAETRQNMANILKSDFQVMISDVKKSDSQRRHDFQQHMQQVKDQLNSLARAWKNLTSVIAVHDLEVPVDQSDDSEIPEVEEDDRHIDDMNLQSEVAESVSPVTEPSVTSENEAESEDVEEVETPVVDETDEYRQLSERIVGLVGEHENGLKMTQIADILDVGNWRSLIPVIRELLDKDLIEKEGSLYFA